MTATSGEFTTVAPSPGTPRSTSALGPVPARPAGAVRPAGSIGPEVDAAPDGWGLPVAVVVIGMFMTVLDTSIVNVAIPTMQKQLGTTAEDIEWVATAYTLTLGVIVPASAWLGERLGLRRMYLFALLGFAASSALCGMAGDLETLVIFRILQGIPGGMMPVTCLTILYKVVPREKLGTAMGMYGLGIVVAPGIGPTLGGYLVEYLNWRLIFYINVPIGILGCVAALFVLPRFPAGARRRFDLPGFACIAGGSFALLLAVSQGQDWGWSSYRVLMLLAASVELLALFVVIELEVEQPLLDVRILKHWPFVNSLLLVSILTMGMFGVLYYVPQFLQEAQNITPMNSGWVLLPQALMMLVMMPVAGRLYDRFGARWLAVVGTAIDGAGILLMVGFNAEVTRLELIVWTMIRACGMGVAIMPIMTAGLSSLPPELVNAGSAFNTLCQRGLSAIGLAALSAMITGERTQNMADRSALLRGVGMTADPRITAMREHGAAGLIPLRRQVELQVEAQCYSDVFLLVGVGTLACVLLALMLRGGRAGSGAESEPVEVG